MPSIKNALSQVEDGNVHLTVEVWSPRHKEAGLFAIRTYYINDQWELRHHTLGYAAIENEREETENLLPTCAATLGQFGMDLNKVNQLIRCTIIQKHPYMSEVVGKSCIDPYD